MVIFNSYVKLPEGTIWYLISRKVRYPLIRRCQKQQFPLAVTGARGRQCPRFGNRSGPLGSIASRRGVPVPRADLMAIAIWVEDGKKICNHQEYAHIT